MDRGTQPESICALKIDVDSRFPIPDSRFPIPDSRFPIPDSRFPIPDQSPARVDDSSPSMISRIP
jgi:hypothetical protein